MGDIVLIPPGLFSANLNIYLIIVFSIVFANLCFTVCYFDGELTVYYMVTQQYIKNLLKDPCIIIIVLKEKKLKDHKLAASVASRQDDFFR